MHKSTKGGGKILFLIALSVFFLLSCQADPITDLRSDNPVIWAQAADALSKRKDPRVLEPLIAAMKNENRHVRKKAAEALGEMGDPKGTEALISALGDEYWEVRKKSVTSLGKIKDTRAIEPLISSLNDKDHDVRFGAARALQNIGTPSIEPLIAALKSGESLIRKGAADSLHEIGWQPKNDDEETTLLLANQSWDKLAIKGLPVVPLLIGMLVDSDGEVRTGAAGALEKIGNPATGPLVVSLKNKNGAVRTEAAEILTKIGWRPANTEERTSLLIAREKWDDVSALGTPSINQLLPMLKDEDSEIRKGAAETLTKVGWKPSKVEEKNYFLLANQNWDELAKMGSSGTDLLIIALKDKDDDIRKKAIESLGKTGDPRGVSPLVTALQDENPDIRFEAAAALKNSGSESTIGPLTQALDDEQIKVGEEAAEGLVVIGTPAVESLIDALAKGKHNARMFAARALGKIGDARSSDPLMDALKDKNWRVVKESALALGKTGDQRSVEPLTALLEEKDPNIREGAAEALGKIGDKRAVLPLIEALADESHFVRSKAAESLGTLGDERAVDSLNTALADTSVVVRKMAAKALAKMNAEPSDRESRINYLIANERWDELIEIGPAAVPSLIDVLVDEDENVRRKSIEILGKLKDPDAIETLIEALKDDDSAVRAEASLALQGMGKPAVKSLITSLNENKDEAVQKASILTLGKMGDKSALNPLLKKLTDWHLNTEAAEALSTLGWRPGSDKERVHWWVATRDSKSLTENWARVQDVLLKDIESSEYDTLENALFAFDFIGREEITPVLIEKLESKGNETIAEAYLNCGNLTLAKAARAWAKKRGFTIK